MLAGGGDVEQVDARGECVDVDLPCVEMIVEQLAASQVGDGVVCMRICDAVDVDRV
ncbi:MAG: hypothetical protein JWO03_1498 [Bacteroidetes bacterium]|nr:hypothetical protein [Bacteroidota bacterium]